MSKKETASPAKVEPQYTKQQFLGASKRFTPQQKDVLAAVLGERQTYTREEATRLVDEFAKRTVR